MNIGNEYNPYRLFVGSFIPNWLMCRTEISPGAKLCFARLCQYAGVDGKCFPAQSTLCTELGTSERQTKRYLAELKEAGLISVIQQGLNRPNIYKFIYHKWMDASIIKDMTEMTLPEVPDMSRQEVPDMSRQEVPDMSRHISIEKNQLRDSVKTDRLTASESVGRSVILPVSLPHEQGIQKEVSDLTNLCKVNNKSVALVIAAGLKSHSPEYVRLQIEYVNDKCKSQRNYRSMLDKAIENKDGKNWGQAYADDKEITARERDAAADKARRANDTSNAIKSLRLHSGKETAVTITLGQNVTGTADGEARESKISEFLSSIKPERVESLKSDFLKSAPTLIRKKHRAQGFDSLLVKTAFESYINKEVLHEAA